MNEDDIENAADEFLSDPDNVSGVDYSDLVGIFIAGARWAEEERQARENAALERKMKKELKDKSSKEKCLRSLLTNSAQKL